MNRRILLRSLCVFFVASAFITVLPLLTLVSSAAGTVAPTAVLTQHNDVSRTGANLNETILTTANVTVTKFGKLFTRTVDGQIYAQPLYVPNVIVPGQGVHNVVYVATMHNSLYAFDADDPGAAAPLWQTQLGPSAPLPSPDIGTNPYYDISVEVGTLSTPVIDPASNTIYAVAFNKDSPSSCTITCTYNYRLHALDLTTGAEKFGGPSIITGTYPGCGWDNSFCVLTFTPSRELQRTGLLLSNGVVYFAFASFGDQAPAHGWVFGYNAATLQRVSLFNSSPDGGYGGIWQSGQGLAADAAGYLYFIIGNGTFNANTVNGKDFGDSFVKVDPANSTNGQLPVADWFTPYNQSYLDAHDIDLGSAGALLIPGTNLVLGGGKEGKLYLVNSNAMGQYNGPAGPDNVVQSFQVTSLASNTGHIHGSPVYWNSPNGPLVYVWGEGDALKAYSLTVHSSISATFLTTPVATGTPQLNPYFMPGGILSISANGNQPGSAIVWASHPMTNANHAVSLGVLRAYDASNVGIELWDSTQNLVRDDVGNYAKFCPPTVVNGKVYLATFSNQLAVYGLLAPTVVTQPGDQTIHPAQPVTVSVTATGQGPLAYQWYVGTSGDTTAPINGALANSYTTTTLTSNTRFWVRVTNSAGSVDSNTALIEVQYKIHLPLVIRN
jgi:hypothetical protein